MRIIGKPIDAKNGYPFFGVVTLLTDSSLRVMKNGKLQWKGFGAFEPSEKKDRSGRNTVSMTTNLDTDFADMLIAWPKGTRLLVAGFMQLSEYWTKRQGKEVYEMQVEFIHDQHNYRAAAGEVLEHTDFPTEDDASDYDPGF